MRCVGITLLVILLLSSGVISADDETNQTDSSIQDGLKIYIDCNSCDFDYLRREISFVNFVRDRKQADVHLLVTRQRTGSGGRDYKVEFIGQNNFENMSDTLSFQTLESDTEDIIRTKTMKIFKAGLIRFVSNLPIINEISINYTKPAEKEEVVDKWNHWVIDISGHSWLNGQKSYRSLNANGNINARRVTEGSRLRFGLWANYNEDKFDYEDYKALSISRSKGIDGSLVFSINDHWSWGYFYDIYSSSYSNKKIQINSTPAIEYNIFPYAESSRRELRIQYLVGLNYVKYEEETIYFKSKEWLTRHTLRTTLEMVQPWGSAEATISASSYLHDFKKNRLQFFGDLSVRLFEGFSFDINGQVSRIRDQLSLRRGIASDEEVLLRQHELATSYSYWLSFGFTYSFGSIYNNIVNSRFGG